VFFSSGDNSEDKNKEKLILNSLNSTKSLGLTDAEITALVKAPMIGVSFSQLKQQAHLSSGQINSSLPGIPTDSANNQMIEWMRAVNEVYQGSKLNILLKGDNAAKYPAFKNVIDAFKKNDLLKFQMVTNPEGVPEGTELYKQAMAGKTQDEL
jgi:hypothetical protein